MRFYLNKAIIGLLLCSIIIGFMDIKSNAAEQVVDSGSATINVSANIQSVFEVAVPDSVEITERGVKEFDIVAKGFTQRTEILYLNISDTMTMTSGGNSINLPVAIDKDSFYYDELIIEDGTTTKCRIDASRLSSGPYTGELEVDIQLKNFELPEGLNLRPLIVVYKDSSNKYHIVSVESKDILTYKESSGYIGYNGNGIASAIQYHEDANGVFQGGTEDRIWDLVIHEPSVNLIYSNYDIKYNNRDEIFFGKTTFN